MLTFLIAKQIVMSFLLLHR